MKTLEIFKFMCTAVPKKHEKELWSIHFFTQPTILDTDGENLWNGFSESPYYALAASESQRYSMRAVFDEKVTWKPEKVSLENMLKEKI